MKLLRVLLVAALAVGGLILFMTVFSPRNPLLLFIVIAFIVYAVTELKKR